MLMSLFCSSFSTRISEPFVSVITCNSSVTLMDCSPTTHLLPIHFSLKLGRQSSVMRPTDHKACYSCTINHRHQRTKNVRNVKTSKSTDWKTYSRYMYFKTKLCYSFDFFFKALVFILFAHIIQEFLKG